MYEFDNFDKKILSALQENGRLTNNELADQVGLSASQCSRRRSALEEKGVICGYHATLAPHLIGMELVSIITINISDQSQDSIDKLHRLFHTLPNVQEAHALTGDTDYVIKVVTANLKELSDLISGTLLPHKMIKNIKTAVVLDTIKASTKLPLD